MQFIREEVLLPASSCYFNLANVFHAIAQPWEQHRNIAIKERVVILVEFPDIAPPGDETLSGSVRET